MDELLKGRSRSGWMRSMALRMKAWADSVLEEAELPGRELSAATPLRGPRGAPREGPAHWLQDVQTMQAGAAPLWGMRTPAGRGLPARSFPATDRALPLQAVIPLRRPRPRAAPLPFAEAPVPPPVESPAPAGERLLYPWPEPSEAAEPEPRDTVALLHQWARLRWLELEPWGE
ncbi:hypothetical protein SAMN05444354_11860 [Stigmatella aurantiaca]|uniref:Uncharacterized protein n=1 Tax=Stigmatella aurantiaca TaxID=41 RepID=A0A1H7Z4J1_STIAU|nr:hypothetical protein [Stigmatella aurantiaca]SEM53101.1 hypothetical protein SAMN05444354_11860 [Stigmatella aurantiaca]